MTEKLKNSLAKVASLMGRKGGSSGQGSQRLEGMQVITGICKESQCFPDLRAGRDLPSRKRIPS